MGILKNEHKPTLTNQFKWNFNINFPSRRYSDDPLENAIHFIYSISKVVFFILSLMMLVYYTYLITSLNHFEPINGVLVALIIMNYVLLASTTYKTIRLISQPAHFAYIYFIISMAISAIGSQQFNSSLFFAPLYAIFLLAHAYQYKEGPMWASCLVSIGSLSQLFRPEITTSTLLLLPLIGVAAPVFMLILFRLKRYDEKLNKEVADGCMQVINEKKMLKVLDRRSRKQSLNREQWKKRRYK